MIDKTDLELYPKVIVNKTLTLHCPVFGVPPPSIQWFKDGQMIWLDGLSHMKQEGEGQKLTILAAKVTDTGSYECQAINVAGLDKIRYELEVYGEYFVWVFFLMNQRSVVLFVRVNYVTDSLIRQCQSLSFQNMYGFEKTSQFLKFSLPFILSLLFFPCKTQTKLNPLSYGVFKVSPSPGQLVSHYEMDASKLM